MSGYVVLKILQGDAEPYAARRASGLRLTRYTTLDDAQAVADWLNERAAGYPALKRFEGGACWPNTYRNGQLVYEP
jgi:hypothetical protein